MKTQVAIIGAGVSGLAAANVLEEAKLDWHLFEASDQIGGRVHTIKKDGFLLDHGFQIFLDAYPEPKRFIDIDSLDLCSFQSGAMIYFKERWCSFKDPRKHPTSVLKSAINPIGNLKDKWNFALWAQALNKQEIEDPPPDLAQSGKEFITDLPLSEDFRLAFLEPFFRGIFLDPKLEIPAGLIPWVMKFFSQGTATLPAKGIGAIPQAMAKTLPLNRLHFSKKIEALESNRVKIATGESIEFDSLIIATDASQACQLLKVDQTLKFNPTTCHWIATEKPPFAHPILGLISTQNGHHLPSGLNHLACVSQAQPNYAPKGSHLLSANTLSRSEPEVVLADLKRLFGDQLGSMRVISSQTIPRALPAMKSLYQTIPTPKNIFISGDWVSAPSLNEAIRSGRQIAEQIVIGKK